jgi:hypothetical protein
MLQSLKSYGSEVKPFLEKNFMLSRSQEYYTKYIDLSTSKHLLSIESKSNSAIIRGLVKTCLITAVIPAAFLDLTFFNLYKWTVTNLKTYRHNNNVTHTSFAKRVNWKKVAIVTGSTVGVVTSAILAKHYLPLLFKNNVPTDPVLPPPSNNGLELPTSFTLLDSTKAYVSSGWHYTKNVANTAGSAGLSLTKKTASTFAETVSSTASSGWYYTKNAANTVGSVGSAGVSLTKKTASTFAETVSSTASSGWYYTKNAANTVGSVGSAGVSLTKKTGSLGWYYTKNISSTVGSAGLSLTKKTGSLGWYYTKNISSTVGSAGLSLTKKTGSLGWYYTKNISSTVGSAGLSLTNKISSTLGFQRVRAASSAPYVGEASCVDCCPNTFFTRTVVPFITRTVNTTGAA